MRILVEKIDLLLQQAVSALQGGRLLAAEEVVAGESAEHARADSGLAVGIATGAAGDDALAVVLGLSGLGLEASAIGEGPAPRLRHL